MADFVLADADAVLVDYVGGVGFLAALPKSATDNRIDISLSQAGVQLDQANLRALVDSTSANTTGTPPIIRLTLEGLGNFSSTREKHTLVFQFIRGTDATRDTGETGVSLTLDVWFEAVGNTVIAYAADGNAKATVYFSASILDLTPLFSASNRVATAYWTGGQALLDLNFFGFLSKFQGLGLDAKLTEGDYHLDIQGLPFTNTSELAISIPIATSANQAPQLVAIADTSLGMNTPGLVTLSASEPESQAIIYSLVSGGSIDTVQAAISDNRLTLTPASGYATTLPIEFTVKASDPNGAYTTQSFSVTVVEASAAHYWGDSTKPIGGIALSNGVPQKTTTTADKAAITLSDVLTTLKYYLGKAQLTGYAVQAADYNDDGHTTLSDVLAILKAYLGKTAPPAWEFEALPNTDPVEYVGILKGDVNGSWMPSL